jgi:hypothetical protein
LEAIFFASFVIFLWPSHPVNPVNSVKKFYLGRGQNVVKWRLIVVYRTLQPMVANRGIKGRLWQILGQKLRLVALNCG